MNGECSTTPNKEEDGKQNGQCATILDMHYPPHLLKLMEVLKRLPGVGGKSAERFAFQMLNWSDTHLKEMGAAIAQVKEFIKSCDQCGCLTQDRSCQFCDDPERNLGVICIIGSARDAFSIERTKEYRGVYHVMGGLLSPIDGRGPDLLHLDKLLERIDKLGTKEVVIALDATLEGDATALYLKQILDPLHLNVSRLAFGLPMGSSLDYVDGDTLGRAMSGRRQF